LIDLIYHYDIDAIIIVIFRSILMHFMINRAQPMTKIYIFDRC